MPEDVNCGAFEDGSQPVGADTDPDHHLKDYGSGKDKDPIYNLADINIDSKEILAGFDSYT